MALLSIMCPHCQTPQAPLESVAFTHTQSGRVMGLFICPICENPIATHVEKLGGSGGTAWHDLHKWTKAIQLARWSVREIWPKPKDSAAPADVPAAIARNFIQAEEAAARTHREAAGMAYRRVLELAMKDKGPGLTGTLQKRIDKLADQGRLTSDMKEWAHSIRTLGNEAAHDEDEPSAADISDLGAFTRVVLEYLYTMPAKVALRAPPPATGAP